MTTQIRYQAGRNSQESVQLPYLKSPLEILQELPSEKFANAKNHFDANYDETGKWETSHFKYKQHNEYRVQFNNAPNKKIHHGILIKRRRLLLFHAQEQVWTIK